MNKINNLSEFIGGRLLYPVRKDLPFLILTWGMLSFPEFLIQIAKGNYFYSILYLFMYSGVAYLFLFMVDFNRKISLFLKPLFFLILTIYTGLNLYCIYRYHCRLNYNIIEILGATNTGEISEYLQMYVDWKYFVGALGYLIACGCLYWFTNYFLKLTVRSGAMSLLIILGLSILSVFINPSLKNEFEVWNFKLEDVADLRKYPTYPDLHYSKDVLPENIIIILGESHAPGHSSIYGYEKPTNPRLEERRDSGNLIVFNNVLSPATNTSNSFKYILNTKLLNADDKTPWYKTTHLIEVLKKAGYETYWFSNQARSGLFNNLASAPADLCDEAIFIREFWNDKKYDGELAALPVEESGKNKAIFFHLMGQHVLFNERYPEGFGKFTPSDYLSLQDMRQKEIMAAYDNATLYNDLVIDSIIGKYEDKDAVIFYFSDHGLDIYETDQEYCGHALSTPESEKIGREIPFIVYMSPKFCEKRPEISNRIRNNTCRSYVTDKFIYSVMDVAGVSFRNSDNVDKFSLFQEERESDILQE